MNIACAEQKAPARVVQKRDLVEIPCTDTLKFTSGIRAIFQDSKGNYWFGSLHEGVAVYDGKSFTYFDRNDGLSDNQIHSIQEDAEGIIWFDTQEGVSSYDGTKVVHRTNDRKGNPSVDVSIQITDPGQRQ